MSDMRAKLDALIKNRQLVTGAELARNRSELDTRRRAGDFEIDRIVPGNVQELGDAGFYLVREDFPLDHVHGGIPLGAALEASATQIALSACDEELEGFDPRSALFVDTETIGLAGGAGTVAFLVGVGYFTEDAFRLDQCFMRDYDDEEAMLQFLAERFAGAETVAGYNSKSFDLPLLQTRFIQNRIPFHGAACMHYDLVHAARRVWKRRLKDCSLQNVEREILGIRRTGDVPGHLIPQTWFDYLRSRDARPLKGVFYHHKFDILSLVSLTAWLARKLDAPTGDGFEHVEDKLSLVRLYFRQRQYEQVVAHGTRFLEVDERSPLRRECFEMLAFAHKRRQEWEAMQEILELSAAEFPSHHVAHLELAKLYEHRVRDLGRALACCDRALETCTAYREGTPERSAWEQRRARIAGKLAKAGLLPEG